MPKICAAASAAERVSTPACESHLRLCMRRYSSQRDEFYLARQLQISPLSNATNIVLTLGAFLAMGWAAWPVAQTTVRPEARAQTPPVPHSGDAADDPAVWIHPQDPELSLILGKGIWKFNAEPDAGRARQAGGPRGRERSDRRRGRADDLSRVPAARLPDWLKSTQGR